jgi:hypothetical protein
MSAFSDYLEGKVLDHVLRNTAYSQPTALTVALFTSTATGAELEAGTLTNEVSGGSYARQTATFGAASGGVASNSGALTFTSMPACTVGYVAVLDQSANVLFYGALSSAKTLNAGDTFTIPTGDLDITLA